MINLLFINKQVWLTYFLLQLDGNQAQRNYNFDYSVAKISSSGFCKGTSHVTTKAGMVAISTQMKNSLYPR